ncbi:hypothetical protein RND81_13G083900 [Saponaria officinalis]|uniref:Replication factor A C-terminal domain-containing protein n=1 Tax=Saponaria officinalis TaxID=3572 RepID=A0AAW1GYZ0_SAPOF
MAPRLTNIATMTPSKSKYQLIARITRIWEVPSTESGQPNSLDMVILDQEGNHIQATNNKTHRPLRSTPHIIKCNPFTSIVEERNQGQPIPKYKFEFHMLDILQERTSKTDYLIDVVVLLTIVEEKRQVITKWGPANCRHIYIQDQSKQPVRVTLWGSAADQINEQTALETADAKVIVITSTKVVYYEGTNQIQSTYGTKIYVNLDIPEVHEVCVCIYRVGYVTYYVPISKEYCDVLSTNHRQRELFICHGTISEVQTETDWKYMSCTKCKKGLQDNMRCNQCKETIEYPMQRYRIMTTVTDGTTSETLVLFDKEAEKIIGKPINKLLDLYEKEDGKGRIFDILQQCVGQEHTYRVKVEESKYGNERELKVQKTMTTMSEKGKGTTVNDSQERKEIQDEKQLSRSTATASNATTVTTPQRKEKRKRNHGEL